MLAALTLPATLPGEPEATVRRAQGDDVADIVWMLADDDIARDRGDAGDGDPSDHRAAFDAIAADASNDVVVVEVGERIVGTLQLTRIPVMSRGGTTRLLVESVRIDSTLRGAGIGTRLVSWVTDVAAVELGASLVQLTSDARRTDAHRFYEQLGFTASHVGFKRTIGR